MKTTLFNDIELLTETTSNQRAGKCLPTCIPNCDPSCSPGDCHPDPYKSEQPQTTDTADNRLPKP